MSTAKQLLSIMLLTSISGVFASASIASEQKTPIKNYKVKTTSNLAKIGKKAARKQVPILLEFAAADCSYCVLLENEILNPMLLSGDYNDKVIIRKVYIDEDLTVKDFNGKQIPLDKIVLRYGIYVTPTIIFINHKGKELAKRLIGINTVEYFGNDVDKAIDLSIKKIRKSQYSHRSQQ